eukprot:scaffold2718_cov38-Phaeocystis_antarctica.AAC.1
MGRTAAMRRADNKEILTGWATRAGPPWVWPPRFRHRESTILPRASRPKPGEIIVHPAKCSRW